MVRKIIANGLKILLKRFHNVSEIDGETDDCGRPIARNYFFGYYPANLFDSRSTDGSVPIERIRLEVMSNVPSPIFNCEAGGTGLYFPILGFGNSVEELAKTLVGHEDLLSYGGPYVVRTRNGVPDNYSTIDTSACRVVGTVRAPLILPHELELQKRIDILRLDPERKNGITRYEWSPENLDALLQGRRVKFQF